MTPDEPERVVSPEPSAPAPETVEASLGLERSERRQIQMGLAALGFDPGPADGLFGRRTRTAIGDWQSSQGGSATGHLDAEAAKALMAAAEAAAEVAAKKSFSRGAARETLSKALHAVERIQDDFVRASKFALLAEYQSKAGDDRGARRSIDEALAAKSRLDDVHWGHDLLLEYVAGAQAAIGDVQGAFASARRITDEHNRVRALAGIARAQAEAGETGEAARTIGEAMSIAARIGDDSNRSFALVDVASAQAISGDIRGALDTAQTIESIRVHHSIWPLSDIVRAQMERGDAAGAAQSIGTAMRAASRIAEEGDRTNAFADIAAMQAEAGDTIGAANSFNRALQLVQRIADPSERNFALEKIAWTQAETGDIAGALATVRRLPADYNAWWALKTIAEAQARAGDTSGASATAQRVLDAQYRAQSFAGIAEVQMKAGNTLGAARLIVEALTTAEHIGDYDDSIWAYTAIARVQLEGGSP